MVLAIETQKTRQVICDRNAIIVARFKSGETASDIARSINLTRERVRQILEKNGVRAGGHQQVRIDDISTRLLEAYKQAPYLTYNEMAKWLGVRSILQYYDKLQLKPLRDGAFHSAQLKAKFWTKINITANPNECWEWQSTFCAFSGYPIQGRVVLGQSRAQVVAYALTYGEPEGWVINTCDNIKCLNPNHLKDVSPKDAIAVRERRIRANPSAYKQRGRRTSKYNAEIVAQVKKLHKTMSAAKVAKTLGIPRGSIQMLVVR